jgi:hypothetical protein
MPQQLFAERVQRGAAWLDQHQPGWDKTIDIYSLDIQFTNCCVIGQIFGDYNEWYAKTNDQFVRRHGFDCLHRKDKNFGKLTKVWMNEIARRQERIRGMSSNQICIDEDAMIVYRLVRDNRASLQAV